MQYRHGSPISSLRYLDTENLAPPIVMADLAIGRSPVRRSDLGELPIPDKVELDVEYRRHRSFWFDPHLLWLTLARVMCQDGVLH